MNGREVDEDLLRIFCASLIPLNFVHQFAKAKGSTNEPLPTIAVYTAIGAIGGGTIGFFGMGSLHFLCRNLPQASRRVSPILVWTNYFAMLGMAGGLGAGIKTALNFA